MEKVCLLSNQKSTIFIDGTFKITFSKDEDGVRADKVRVRISNIKMVNKHANTTKKIFNIQIFEIVLFEIV